MKFEAWRSALADRVRALREQRGLRQQDLETWGVSEHTVQAIEYGATDPKASTLWKLAEGLGVSLAELVDVRRD